MLIRPVVAVPTESYTPERRAELLLSNAVNDEDSASAPRKALARDGAPTPPPLYTASLKALRRITL